MTVHVGVHATINGRYTDELGGVDLDHPETSVRDVAAVLREIADELEADGRFYEIATRLLDDEGEQS